VREAGSAGMACATGIQERAKQLQQWLAVDQATAPLVKNSFLLVAAGNHTTDAILRTVTAMELKSKRGMPGLSSPS
jgi:hypothetical protein